MSLPVIPCLMLIAHEILSFMLLWSVFCRSAIAHGQETRLSMKIALMALGASSLTALGAPVYGWHPDAVSLALLLGIVFMQITAAELWRNGVPEQFRKTLMP